MTTPSPADPPGLPTGGGPPDPWGMKRVENLITALTGVLSARVVVTPLGEVSEVHVLTKSDMQPKQVVRNIESALMAQLGFKIDHRKISVAQTADVRPIEALQEEAISERSKRRVVVFKNLEVRPSERPQRVQLRVTLAFGEKEAQAEEVGTDTTRNRVEAAARATASCLDDLLLDNSIALEAPKSSKRSIANSYWSRCTAWADVRRNYSPERVRFENQQSAAPCSPCSMRPIAGWTRGAN